MNTPEVLFIPLVLGLTEVAKRAGLPIRLVPVLSVILGVGLGYFLGFDWTTGIVVGLSSSGLWSSTKAVLGK